MPAFESSTAQNAPAAATTTTTTTTTNTATSISAARAGTSRAPFENAFQGIIRARLRDEYHAGTGCRALLFLTDAEMAEPPITQFNEPIEFQNGNYDHDAVCTERNAHEPALVPPLPPLFPAAGSI